MKTILALLALFALPAYAAPFLVTDPVDANADRCVLTMKGAAPQELPVITEAGQRICKVDVGPIFAVGPNDLTLSVKNALWGVASTAVPFAASKPGTVQPPSNIRLVP